MMRAALAHTLGAAGRPVEAGQILDDLTSQARQKYVAPYFLAGIHVGLGENDRALEYLDKAFEEHSNWLLYLHMDPSMDGLRDEPRFQDLLRRIGLPPDDRDFHLKGNRQTSKDGSFMNIPLLLT